MSGKTVVKRPVEGPGFSLYDDDDDVPDSASAKKSKEEAGDDATVKITEPVAAKVGPSKSSEEIQPAFKMLSGLGSLRGEREDMQDAHVLFDHFHLDKDFVKRCALYGVYDGHAGARAADFCEKMVADILKKKLSSFSELSSMEKALKRVFTETYKSIDDAFLAEAKKGKPVWKDGTTASTVIVLNNAVYVANIGDSRVVACREKTETNELVAIPLTTDHNPLVYEERMRIQKAGASVKDGRINGVIEVSRSIGDGQFKTLGVICAPDMKKLTITDQDRFLIVACDGLWKVFPNEEAIKFVTEQLKIKLKDDEILSLSGKTEEHMLWNKAASSLAAEAVRRKCGDNVSVILVKLSKVEL